STITNSSRPYTLLGSISQLKNDVNGSGGVHWRSFASSRFEANLFGRAQGAFIQTMTKTARDAKHFDVSVCGKKRPNQHFTFNLQLASFFRVIGTRLVGDFHRALRSFGFPFVNRRCNRACSEIAEAAFLYSSSCSASSGTSGTRMIGRSSITESGTHNDALHALCSAGSIACTRANR